MQFPKGHSGKHKFVMDDSQYLGKPCSNKDHHVTIDGKLGSIRTVMRKSCYLCDTERNAKRRREAYQREDGDAFLMRSKLDEMNELKRLEREMGEVWHYD